MPDIAALLDRTTPDDLAPLDVDALVRRSRRRRTRRRAMAASAAAAAVVLVSAATATILGGGGEAPSVTMPATGPNGMALVEPVGAWRQAEDPPFSARTDAFGGALSDGRVLVWGGHTDSGDDPDDPEAVPTGFADGGVLDPRSGEWQAIPDAPVPPPTTGGASVTSVQLADDRLAVVTGSADGALHAAVYDVATGQWTGAPSQSAIPTVHDGMAWDGETLVLVRTRAGEGEWQVDQPVTLRWTPGDDRWVAGARPPVGVRNFVGTAFDGQRLALWGGSTASFIDDTGGYDLFGDGALYDVASDTWQALPSGPPGRTHASLQWSDGRLLVGGGIGTADEQGDYLPDVWAYDRGTGSWEELPPAPEGGLAGGSWNHYVGGERRVVAAESQSGTSGPQPRWMLGHDGWEQAPSWGVLHMGDLTVATSVGWGNPGDEPFGVQIRAGRDHWLDAAPAPFVNRMAGTIVGTADRLVVVGGMQGHDIELTGEAWMFDLAASPAGGA